MKLQQAVEDARVRLALRQGALGDGAGGTTASPAPADRPVPARRQGGPARRRSCRAARPAAPPSAPARGCRAARSPRRCARPRRARGRDAGRAPRSSRWRPRRPRCTGARRARLRAHPSPSQRVAISWWAGMSWWVIRSGSRRTCVRDGLQPVEPVRHHAEQAEERRERCPGCSHRHAKQPAKVVALGRCHQVQSPLDPLKRRGCGAGYLFQYGDPGLHIDRISATADGFNGYIRHVHRSMVNGEQSASTR